MMSNRQGDVNPTVSNADSNEQQKETRTSTVSLTSAANTVVNVEQRHTMVPTDEFNILMKYIDNLNRRYLCHRRPTHRRLHDRRLSQ